MILGPSKEVAMQMSNQRTLSPLIELFQFSPKRCLFSQHIFYEGILPKVFRLLFPTDEKKKKKSKMKNIFSSNAVIQMTQRLRVYPFFSEQHKLDSMMARGWTSSQFMNLLEALPLILRNMLSSTECCCPTKKLPTELVSFYHLPSQWHHASDHYLQLVEVNY